MAGNVRQSSATSNRRVGEEESLLLNIKHLPCAEGTLLLHLIMRATLVSGACHSHLFDEESTVQRPYITSWRSHSW